MTDSLTCDSPSASRQSVSVPVPFVTAGYDFEAIIEFISEN